MAAHAMSPANAPQAVPARKCGAAAVALRDDAGRQRAGGHADDKDRQGKRRESAARSQHVADDCARRIGDDGVRTRERLGNGETYDIGLTVSHALPGCFFAAVRSGARPRVQAVRRRAAAVNVARRRSFDEVRGLQASCVKLSSQSCFCRSQRSLAAWCGFSQTCVRGRAR